MATPTTLPATFVAGNVLQASQLNDLRGAFRVLQVVSTTKTDTFTYTGSITYQDITGLNVAITPSSTSSKVLVIATINGIGIGGTTNSGVFLKFTGGNTANAIGDTAGSRVRAITDLGVGTANFSTESTMLYLDSPATTSATTYQVQVALKSATETFYLNRSSTDTDSTAFGRFSSTVTAMEISA